VLESNPPVGALLANDDLKVGERVVDAVVAWEGVTRKCLLEDRRHAHLVKTRFHRPPPLTPGQVQPDVQAPHEGPHQVLAQDDVIRERPRLRAPAGHLPRPAEQPQARIMTVLGESEDELPVEVVLVAAPRVPALPFRWVVSQDVDGVVLAVEHRAVQLARARVEIRRQN